VKASKASQTESVQALLEDMCGQSTEALSRQDWFIKWGVHYMPSLMFAHRLQQCNNFKDPGVQGYAGKLFEAIRDEADDIFNNLPAPKPSVHRRPSAGGTLYSATGPVSMAAYNNSAGVCLDGASLVQLTDGMQRRLDELQRGDWVMTLDGESAEVMCLVRTMCPTGRANLVELPGSGLRLTPYHPIFVEGAWKFPADVAEPCMLECNAVFSLELRGAPAFVAAGVPCVTLGHGITEGVAVHPYFGTMQVLEDIRKFPSYSEGLVDLRASCVVRDPMSGLITGLRP